MTTNPEFDKFTGFMDKLAKVPHDELKAELEAEKREKKQPADSTSSEKKAANLRGKALAAAMRKLPDNPQVEH